MTKENCKNQKNVKFNDEKSFFFFFNIRSTFLIIFYKYRLIKIAVRIDAANTRTNKSIVN